MILSGNHKIKNKTNIHLIVAMQPEAAFIIQKLNLTKINHESVNSSALCHIAAANIDVYHAETNEHNIHLFVNKQNDGMDRLGTVNAALLTYKSILFMRPDFILSVGTCGGINVRGVKLFDIITPTNFVMYHDRFTGTSDGSVKQSLEFLPCVSLTTQFECKQGVIASGNSLVLNSQNWANIHKYNVLCLDMEAAAVAQVAKEFAIPFSAFKVVTDDVYEINPVDAFSHFEKNFDQAMTLLAENLAKGFFTR